MKSLNKKKPRNKSVYVVELDDSILSGDSKLSKTFLEANPDRGSSKSCVYVGRTGLTPEDRLAKHLAAKKNGKGFVTRYGVRLLPHLYEHLNPMTWDEVEKMEKSLAIQLMATREVSELLPPVNSLVNCPILAEVDGRLEVLGKGYHSVCGGVLVAQGDTPPLVCIDVAVKDLKEKVLGEFDFQSGGDYSRAIASLMTPALRLGRLLKGNIPVDVAEADKSQSGKTYRHKLICAVYNETTSVIADRKGGVGSADASFAQALINGRPFIQFDNWRGKLDSQMQEAFLTAEGSFPARVPHRSEVTVDSRRFQLMLTSNGVETTRDLANRSSIIRIRKREDFSYQTYPEGDLLDHVKANQQHYLGCVFAVARVWHEQGCQRTRSTDHDFREWAQSLDWIVQELFGVSPLMDGHLKAQERVSSPAMTWLRKIGVALEKTGHLEGEMFASSIVEFCEDEAIEIPGVKEAADSDQANKKVGILMKKVFGEGESIDVDDYHVERRETQIKRDDGNGYYPSRTYVFSKTPEPQQPHPPQ